MLLDHRDSSHCPVGYRCESCGVAAEDHEVLVIQTPEVGHICLTTCVFCRDILRLGMPPPITMRTATNLARQHREHVEEANHDHTSDRRRTRAR